MKRVVSLCLAICMVLSLSTFVYAGDDKGLEKAILAVKAVIDIPDEYTVFNYSTNEYQGELYWNFTWSDAKYENTINVQADGENTVLSYNKYSRDGQSGNLSNISKAEGETYARAFLGKAIPTLASEFRLVTDENVSYYYSNTEFVYSFRHYVNDIPVINSKVMIGVNKFTGEVTFYSGYKLYKGGYKAPENVITLDAAKEKYIQNIGIELMYNSYFDYQNRKINVYPVYSPNVNKNEAIDAFTGKNETLATDDNRNGMGSKEGATMSDGAKNAAAGANLSPQEEKAVTDMTNLITKEKAANIIKAYFPNEGIGYELESANLYKDYYENTKYTWDISFRLKQEDSKASAGPQDSKAMPIYLGASGRVNAMTGEVISFYCTNYNDETDKGISEEVAKAEAYSFIQKLAPDKVRETKLREDNNYYYPPVPMLDKVETNGENKPTQYTYTYTRYANGIAFSSNSISVTYDVRAGRVTSYYVNWYDNVTFPPIGNVIGDKAAFDCMASAAGYGLMYRDKSADEKRLVYDFESKGNMIFDAFTGKQLGYDGKPAVNQNAPVYVDIKGHWCEPIVNKLLENGIYISGSNEFKPDKNITQYNFLKYLMSSEYKTDNQDEFYNMLLQRGILQNDEVSPGSLVTRQDAVVFVVRMLGHEKIAKHYEIYNYPFKDNVADKYKGYISIAYALGIIKGDNDSNFNPGNSITNAEAASIIYNVMTAK